MDITTIIISLSAGACIGAVAGGWAASRKFSAALSGLRTLARDDLESIIKLERIKRDQGREIADLRAEIFARNAIEHARQSGLRAANAQRKAEAAEARAKAEAITNARHAEMRELVGLV